MRFGKSILPKGKENSQCDVLTYVGTQMGLGSQYQAASLLHQGWPSHMASSRLVDMVSSAYGILDD